MPLSPCLNLTSVSPVVPSLIVRHAGNRQKDACFCEVCPTYWFKHAPFPTILNAMHAPPSPPPISASLPPIFLRLPRSSHPTPTPPPRSTPARVFFRRCCATWRPASEGRVSERCWRTWTTMRPSTPACAAASSSTRGPGRSLLRTSVS